MKTLQNKRALISVTFVLLHALLTYPPSVVENLFPHTIYQKETTAIQLVLLLMNLHIQNYIIHTK